MSESTKTAPVANVPAEVSEKVVKGPQKVKANSRGYAYLGKLGLPVDFKAIKNVEFRGQAGTPIQEIVFGGESDAGNMLRRGYVCVGPDAEVEVEAGKNGLFITPVIE